ncbi:hypothetical protein HanRHA438_Chr10g0443941 [Helianthus annuus]|nr:hypothetical protein HanIR_Chr10g0465381 [Helianthus annuus]KAJ0878798.1 hypothetical protein HanRHA438_Chr10g0443941 [Helianthus annuus]
MEKGDLGEEGLEDLGVLGLVLHLNLGVILRLSMTEEWNLASSPLGRKRSRGVVELLSSELVLERKLQLDCNLGVEVLKKPPEEEEDLVGVGCWTSPRIGESDEFRGIVVQKALRQPVPIEQVELGKTKDNEERW